MNQATLSRLRPANGSSWAIEGALSNIPAERQAASNHLAATQEARKQLLLTGQPQDIKAAQDRLETISIELCQLDAIEAALGEQLLKAKASEAAALKQRKADVAHARKAIDAFRAWIEVDYERHAKAIAAGMEMERAAWAAWGQAGRDPSLPALPRTFSGAQSDCGTAFHHIVRLPGVGRGPRICWAK